MTTHGVDYLVDYYALLGIERSATSAEIASAYREMIKQYHADRFQGLAPELLAQAEHKTRLLNEAYAVLEDDARRASYDETLANWTKPLSKGGEVIIDLNDDSFSFGRLIDHLSVDEAQFDARADELALQFSGFEKATYEFFKQQASSPQGIPDALRPAYLEQLERRELYLSLREGFVWESLGKRNRSETPKLEYWQQSQAGVEEIKKEANTYVADQVLRLTSGQQILLPAPEGMESDPGRVIAHYEAQVEEHFDRQLKKLEPLAREHQEVLNARFVAAAHLQYLPGTRAYTEKLVVGIKAKEEIVWLYMEFNGDDVRVTNPPEGVKDLEKPVTKHFEIMGWMDRGYTILVCNAVQGIDFNDQLLRVAELHQEKMKSGT